VKRVFAVCAVGAFCVGVAVSGCAKKVATPKEANPSMPGPGAYSADAMKAKSTTGQKPPSGGAPSAPAAPK